MNARRTAVRLTFAGVDISTDINKHLLSLTYTDNEEDKTDDLQLSLDDREGVWLGNWLNTPGASKGVEISAVIVQKNWESNGKDRVLDCGVFEIDTVDGSGPPAKATIKAGSIPYKSTVRTQKKTKAWENYTLSSIAKEIAGKNGLTCMFESAFDPLYTRKEQIQESDITFLQRLCKAAGISLKVTAKIIVLFDAAAYEQKDAVRVIKRGTADVSSWSFSTSLHDASYSKCHVSYTDPTTGKTIEYTYTPRNADKGRSSSGSERKGFYQRGSPATGNEAPAAEEQGRIQGIVQTDRGRAACGGNHGSGIGLRCVRREIHHRNGDAFRVKERLQNRFDATPGIGGVLMADLSVLKNIVRTGRVSSVNAGNRTARVTFEDKGQSPLVSGELKVIKNPPFIPAKGAAQRTESESGGSGEAAFAAHSHAVKIAPWLPSPGDYVLCLYIPTDDGDGFVIGGI